MPGTVHFTGIDQGRRIEVRRDDEVPDDFWRKVRAEWGQVGEHPNTAVVVPVEVFAGRHAWLPAASRRFGVLPSLDPISRSIVRRGREDRVSLQELLSGARDPSPEEASSALNLLQGTRFRRELRPFQERDIAKLLSLKHGANFSVPGSGKTTVELAIYEAERAASRVDRLLVVAPLSAFEAWVRESGLCLSPAPLVQRYAGGSIAPSTEILLVTYQRLTAAYPLVSEWVERHDTLVVLDEAHRMKRGRDGEWGSACLDLAFVARRRDVLTGTPAPQHPADLVAILDFLWRGQARRVLPSAALVPQPTPESVAQITPAIAPLFVRTTKQELALKEPIKKIINVALTGLHAEIYTSLRMAFSQLVKTQRDRLELSSWSNIVMYLLEAATNPALLPAGSSTDDPIEFRHPPLGIPENASLHELISDYASYETPAKFIQLAALVQRLREEDQKVLIWSNFVRNLETLERLLARYEPSIVHGGIPSDVSQPTAPRTREAEIERFRTSDNCGVLLANPAAMGEGIGLHDTCHHAIYLERTFNAGQYLQSVDRIHRLGMPADKETTIYFLVSEATIDVTVASRIEIKARNLGTILDDPTIVTMALPDDEDVGEPLEVGDDADLTALFAHLRGDQDAR